MPSIQRRTFSPRLALANKAKRYSILSWNQRITGTSNCGLNDILERVEQLVGPERRKDSDA
jgi:hypothetical protein